MVGFNQALCWIMDMIEMEDTVFRTVDNIRISNFDIDWSSFLDLLRVSDTVDVGRNAFS